MKKLSDLPTNKTYIPTPLEQIVGNMISIQNIHKLRRNSVYMLLYVYESQAKQNP